MQKLKFLVVFISILFYFNIQNAFACHPLPLLNFTQQTYTPGVGLQVTADSDPNTFGCNWYWLEMEFRCDPNKMDDTGFGSAYDPSQNCVPFFQGAQVNKPFQMPLTYPGITIPDSILCPGMTYYYRLRENIDFNVGIWSPILSFTMPGTLDTNMGHLILTANPQVFCGSTQLGWNLIPGGGCRTSGCEPIDTSYQWYVISGEPINVPVNFSCDTCPYPIASPSIPTTYGLTITIGDTNACGYGVYTMTPITVTPLPFPIAGPLSYESDCNGNVSLEISNYQGSIQWQSSATGTWTNIAGATTDSIYLTGVTSGDCFTVQLTTSCGSIFSDTICMGTITPPQTGTVNYTADCNGNVDLEINGYVGNIQWQTSTGGGPWLDISSANMDTLTQSGIISGDCFRVEISTDCDTIYSDTVCIIIPDFPVNGVISYTADCSGNIDLWVDSAQGNIQWQSSIAGGAWNDIPGATSDSLSQSGINTGDCFRVQIYTVCDTIYTDTVCPTMLVGPTANFTFSPPGNSQSNVPMSFMDQSTGNIVSWEWDFGDNSPAGNGHIPNPTHTYHNDGIYYVTLIVTDINGCSDTITIPVEIIDPACNGHKCIIVPNVFTPNGDGDNDLLVFKNLENYENQLQLFNRWGKLIFEETNYKNDWNGANHNEGTYYFLLQVFFEPNGEPYLYKGNITILR